MLAFAQFIYAKALAVFFKVVVYGWNSPGEFWGMVLESFFIGALVLIVLALIKKGVKIMHNLFRKALNRGHRPKQNEEEMKRKSALAWV